MSKRQKKSNVLETKSNKTDALIFIDTNIFLDFYRMPSEKISLQMIDKIVEHKDIIICSTQSEMEFKNNRFGVLKWLLDEYKKIGNFSLMIPEIFVGDESDALVAARNEIAKQQQALSKKLSETIESTEKDEVFIKLDKLFKNDSNYNLRPENHLQQDIYNLAERRFNLGYPPRKPTDKTFGDSFHWEWILKCAEISSKKIIIVSRDGDFGKGISEPVLNPFLRDEVKYRIGSTCEITLTNEIGKAFEMVHIPLSQEMVEEEKRLINIDSVLTENIRNSAATTSWDDFVKMLNRTSVSLGPNYNLLTIDAVDQIYKATGVEKLQDAVKKLGNHKLNFSKNDSETDQ